MSRNRTVFADRLTRLQQSLSDLGVDGFILRRGDDHMGEYVPAASERLAWLTGFTGSAGMVVVRPEGVALFVDGRYTLQAPTQVPEHVAVINVGDVSPAAWLAEQVADGAKIGFDPALMAAGQVGEFRDALAGAGAELLPLADNPVDALWTDRPPMPAAPMVVHPMTYAGQDAAEKRRNVAASLANSGLEAFLISAPESVAWLLNVRGADLAHTPVTLAFALIHADGDVDLMVDADKVDDAVRAHLGPDVRLSSYDGLAQVLAARDWPADARVGLDRVAGSERARLCMQEAGLTVVVAQDPCALPKAVKNTVEVDGIRAAHVRDGAALSSFLAWLSQAGPAGTETEISASEKLLAFRARSNAFRCTSFDTISGAGPNGAIVHYFPTPETDRALKPGDVYLVDSGGQYPDGTTDVTRTVAIGDVPQEARENFTRVLKGHIALARARFAKGTSGPMLDVLARAPLWEAGLDFDHGTGHGVGAFLSVHEGPQNISRRPGGPALQPGMILSNEPGYYKTGAYGIRIENLVAVREEDIPGGERTVYGFETLTLAPIDRNMTVAGMLDAREREWLNAYHARVLAEVGPLVDAPTQGWLEQACAPI